MLTDVGHITISEKARQKVFALKDDGSVGQDFFLRVSVKGGGCSGLSYNLDFDDEIKPVDQIFDNEGIKIVCDLKSFLYLSGTELDFSDGLNGKGFFFNNPNAKRTCGCGESFAI